LLRRRTTAVAKPVETITSMSQSMNEFTGSLALLTGGTKVMGAAIA
jgi:hypothetical protein